MAEVIADFDLEGTLFQGSSLLWIEILKWKIRHSHNVVRVIGPAGRGPVAYLRTVSEFFRETNRDFWEDA